MIGIGGVFECLRAEGGVGLEREVFGDRFVVGSLATGLVAGEAFQNCCIFWRCFRQAATWPRRRRQDSAEQEMAVRTRTHLDRAPYRYEHPPAAERTASAAGAGWAELFGNPNDFGVTNLL